MILMGEILIFAFVFETLLRALRNSYPKNSNPFWILCFISHTNKFENLKKQMPVFCLMLGANPTSSLKGAVWFRSNYLLS